MTALNTITARSQFPTSPQIPLGVAKPSLKVYRSRLLISARRKTPTLETRSCGLCNVRHSTRVRVPYSQRAKSLLTWLVFRECPLSSRLSADAQCTRRGHRQRGLGRAWCVSDKTNPLQTPAGCATRRGESQSCRNDIPVLHDKQARRKDETVTIFNEFDTHVQAGTEFVASAPTKHPVASARRSSVGLLRSIMQRKHPSR